MLDVDDPADPSTGPRRRGLAAFLLSGEGWPYVLAPFIPIAVALELLHAGAALIATAAIRVIPTVALMGKATEELADRVERGIGGLLNVTFGKFPELQRLRARRPLAGGDHRQPHHGRGRIDLFRGPDAVALCAVLAATFLFAPAKRRRRREGRHRQRGMRPERWICSQVR